jgi:hypothetical protein
MEKVVNRIRRRSIDDKNRTDNLISRSQDRLMALHKQQMNYYEKEQKIMEVR